MKHRRRSTSAAYNAQLKALVQGIEEAQNLGLTKPYDLAVFGLDNLQKDQRLRAQARTLARHRAADPHCTCPGCIEWHDAHTREDGGDV